jgi:hypothetical protein
VIEKRVKDQEKKASRSQNLEIREGYELLLQVKDVLEKQQMIR